MVSVYGYDYYLYVIPTRKTRGPYLTKSISWFSIGLEHCTCISSHTYIIL